MKHRILNKKDLSKIELTTSNLQQLYVERIEKFMALVELSYALKHAPRIIQKK